MVANGTHGHAASGAARPTLHERTQYEPNLPQEEFIVPLLGRVIESCLERYARPARGTAKAVDIGCGGQPFRSLLERIGYEYCAVDVNPDGGPPVDVVAAADQRIPDELLRRGPFDFLLCTEVLEHVADWEAAFGNFAQLMARGGRALITAPFVYQLHEEPYDFWRPTSHAIGYSASRAGLRILYQEKAGNGWDVIGTILAACRFVPSSRRLTDRATARMLRVVTRSIHRVLRRGALQKHARAEGPLYLSNVAVLEKP